MKWYRQSMNSPKQPWEMTKEEFVPRKDTVAQDQAAYPAGTRRIGDEGYIDTVVEVPVDSITPHPANTIYQQTVQKYVEDPGTALPLVMLEPDGALTLDDGHHRVAAAKERGEQTIKVWMRDASDWPRSATHEWAVQKALAEGKQVPKEVLNQYPHLAN